MSRFITPTLASLKPYTPGEQPPVNRRLVKLNTNENPYPPSSAVVDAIRDEEWRLQLYPDPGCAALRRAAAWFYGVAEDEVMAGNGSDEVLFFALRAFCDGSHGIARADITYTFYDTLCQLLHLPQRILPLREDFTIDPAAYRGLDETIVIANPNAPTGLALDPEEIGAIAAANPDCVVIVDEAYVDFGAKSCVPLTRRYENLLVVQTFSKSRQLAGARLGLAIGSRELIADLERVRGSLNPYNVSRTAQAAGTAALYNRGYFEETCRQIAETRAWAAEQLAARGFAMTDSLANFLFVNNGRMSGAAFTEALRRKNVVIRYFDLPRIRPWVRISVGTQEQMEVLLERVDRILQEG